MAGLDQICMILDLDGYQVNHQPFIVREMGIYSLPYGSFSWPLENRLPYLSLEKRDRQRVNYVYHHVHGLRFESTKQENSLPQHMVKPMIEAAFHRSKSQDQYVVAYKGGHVEKDLLNELHIPSVNLEDYGCPKVDKLLAMGFNPECGCGHHAKPTLHCPKQETWLFYQWMIQHMWSPSHFTQPL